MRGFAGACFCHAGDNSAEALFQQNTDAAQSLGLQDAAKNFALRDVSAGKIVARKRMSMTSFQSPFLGTLGIRHAVVIVYEFEK